MIPSLVNKGSMRNVLPYGRYLATLDEIADTFVPECDENRQEIWDSFNDAINVARLAFGEVIGVWIGGSFITSEQNPHDIDVVFLIKEDAYKKASLSNEKCFFANILINREIEFVDSYILVVPPTEITQDGIPELQKLYLNMRGYWDQFWSKSRFEGNNNRWLYPAAGYLQVVIDGYDS